MFGISQYITGGALILAVSGAGYGVTQRNAALSARLDLQMAQVTEARAKGALVACAARITNIQEANESNASIPDDLGGFVVPDGWMLEAPAD